MMTSPGEYRRVLLELLPEQGNVSEADYLWLTDDTSRLIEYTDGYVEMLPAPTDEHQNILGWLSPHSATTFCLGAVQSASQRCGCDCSTGRSASPTCCSCGMRATHAGRTAIGLAPIWSWKWLAKTSRAATLLRSDRSTRRRAPRVLDRQLTRPVAHRTRARRARGVRRARRLHARHEGDFGALPGFLRRRGPGLRRRHPRGYGRRVAPVPLPPMDGVPRPCPMWCRLAGRRYKLTTTYDQPAIHPSARARGGTTCFLRETTPGNAAASGPALQPGKALATRRRSSGPG